MYTVRRGGGPKPKETDLNSGRTSGPMDVGFDTQPPLYFAAQHRSMSSFGQHSMHGKNPNAGSDPIFATKQDRHLSHAQRRLGSFGLWGSMLRCDIRLISWTVKQCPLARPTLFASVTTKKHTRGVLGRGTALCEGVGLSARHFVRCFAYHLRNTLPSDGG